MRKKGTLHLLDSAKHSVLASTHAVLNLMNSSALGVKFSPHRDKEMFYTVPILKSLLSFWQAETLIREAMKTVGVLPSDRLEQV